MEKKNIFSKFNPFLKQQALQKIISHCPLCNYEYKSINAKIIRENEEAQLVYMKCPNCFGSLIILIINSGPLISAMGIVTDLNENDISKLNNVNVIQDEDIINLHELLKKRNFCWQFKNNF